MSGATAWPEVALTDAVDFLDSERRPVKVGDREKMRGDIPYYGASGVVDYVNDYLFDEDLILLGEDGENILSRSLPLAFKISGKSWVNNHAHVLRPKADFDIDFLTAYLESLDYSALNTGTAQPKLNKQSCAMVRVLKPSLREQRRIAKALGDSDRLITALERMIVKKRSIKQGLVQELLTGKSRLPGFAGPWAVTTLGAIGHFLKGRGIKRDDVRSSGVSCIRYGEIYTSFGDHTHTTVSYVASDIASNALPILTGDVLFAGSGETRDEIGKSVAWVGERHAVAGGDVIILRPRGCNSVFLGALCNSAPVAAQKARAGQGDAVVHIYRDGLSGITIGLPELDEQNAIASVIADATMEIDALTRKLHKARNIKQGMMQELLAGRSRLPVEAVA